MNLLELALEMNPWWREPKLQPASAFGYRRKLFAETLRRLTASDRAILLVGLQRTGKTVLLRQLADAVRFDPLPDSGGSVIPHGNVTYVDLSDVRLEGRTDLFALLEAQPAGYDASSPRLLLLDEIVRLPDWPKILKTVIDRSREGKPGSAGRSNVRIVATGSSARTLDQDSREARIGRFDLLEIEPLDFVEFLGFRSREEMTPQERLKERPDELETYLRIGGLPEAALVEPIPALDAALGYVRRTVEDTVTKEALRAGLDPRVFDLFRRLARRSGDMIQVQNLAGDLECSPNSVRQWLDFLFSTRMLRELKPLWAGAKPGKPRHLHVKAYATDHGMVSALEAAQRLPESAVPGKIFETVVFRHLRELARAEACELGFIRWEHEEVDFVLRWPKEPIAIEVTASASGSRKAKALDSLQEKIPFARRVVVHGGQEERERGAVLLLPIHRFLLEPWRVLPGR